MRSNREYDYFGNVLEYDYFALYSSTSAITKNVLVLVFAHVVQVRVRVRVPSMITPSLILNTCEIHNG